MDRRRLVVIGGDAAGMSAASQARRRRGPDELDIVAFERGRATSYSACGIPYWISGVVEHEEQLVSRSPETAPAQPHRRPHAHRGRSASTSRAAMCGPATSTRAASTTSRYDDLVYAAGSVPDAAAGPGYRRSRRVRRADPRRRRRTARRAHRGRAPGRDRRRRLHRLEVAEACQVRGLQVTVVDRSPTPVGTFDPDIGEFIADAVRGLGIDLVLGDAVAEIVTDPDGRAAARAHRVRASAAGRPRRARAGRAAQRRARPRGRDPARPVGRHRRRPPHAHPGRRACGRRATASSRSTGCPASGSWWRWARTPTSRAGWRGSTSAAATPRSPA